MVEKLFTSKLNRISLHTLSHLLFNMVISLLVRVSQKFLIKYLLFLAL